MDIHEKNVDMEGIVQSPSTYLKVANKVRWFLGELNQDYTFLIRGQSAAWGAKVKSVKANYSLNTNIGGGHSYLFVNAEVPLIVKWFKWGHTLRQRRLQVDLRHLSLLTLS
jgi:hypothetical protein